MVSKIWTIWISLEEGNNWYVRKMAINPKIQKNTWQPKLIIFAGFWLKHLLIINSLYNCCERQLQLLAAAAAAAAQKLSPPKILVCTPRSRLVNSSYSKEENPEKQIFWHYFRMLPEKAFKTPAEIFNTIFAFLFFLTTMAENINWINVYMILSTLT